ncbi:MAG: hypothetical protein K2X81_11380 [Candidatus Obscuribacterales bacterium]|nr:hypothetical protein [Candidatus Obscuribacterales bacterium]
MSARKAFFEILVVSLFSAASLSPALAAADESKTGLPLTLEQMTAKRKAVREELMLPSLAGIKTIAYRVVGYKNFEPLDKIMAGKLAKLDVPLTPLVKASNNTKCDAIVQISFFKAGINNIAEIKVTQWVSLLRNPKVLVRAVTWSDKTYFVGNKPEDAVDQLSTEFVVDFLKANQKSADAEKGAKTKEAGGKEKK